MGQLFGRTCTLTLGTTQIKCAQAANAQAGPEQSGGLAIVFRVKKNLKPEPNSVEIKVWNLAPSTRLSLEQPKTVPVQLDVGYGGDNHTIFLGQLRGATSEIEGPNIVTTISSGDNEHAFSQARVKFAIPASASPQQIMTLAVQAMTAAGVGSGNAQQMVSNAIATTGGPGKVVMGNPAKVLGQIMRSSGMQWSVQDGALQVMPIGQAIGSPATAVLLSTQTGMVGSPTSDNKGIVKVESLIQPGLTPGLPVVIQAVSLSGAYRIEDAEFSGATWGAPWTVTLHARKWK